MTEASVGFAGNLTDQPEVRSTEAGIARAMFRVAVSGRREQEPSCFTVIVWRDQAQHAGRRRPRPGRRTAPSGSQLDRWDGRDAVACSRSVPSSKATIEPREEFSTNSGPACGRPPPAPSSAS